MNKIDPIYQELASRIQGADKELIPRILSKLANLEQAAIMKALPDKARDPSAGRSLAVSNTFAEKLGMDKEIVDKHIRELFEKGVLFPTRKGPQMARNWMQLHDSTLANPKYDESLGKEFFDLWAEADKKPVRPIEVEFNPETAEFRIIPKWKSIKDIPGILPQEDMREILKSQQLMVLIPCGCKRSFRNRECGIPEESCITVGRAAQYNLDRGLGREISYEEALGLLDRFEEYPIVNLTINQREINTLICNCHWCCCNAVKGAAKSRFIAIIDAEKCKSCRICVDRCQYDAVHIKLDPELGRDRSYVDPELCRGCGDCVIACPSKARGMKIVRPPEHIPETLRIYS